MTRQIASLIFLFTFSALASPPAYEIVGEFSLPGSDGPGGATIGDDSTAVVWSADGRIACLMRPNAPVRVVQLPMGTDDSGRAAPLQVKTSDQFHEGGACISAYVNYHTDYRTFMFLESGQLIPCAGGRWMLDDHGGKGIGWRLWSDTPDGYWNHPRRLLFWNTACAPSIETGQLVSRLAPHVCIMDDGTAMWTDPTDTVRLRRPSGQVEIFAQDKRLVSSSEGVLLLRDVDLVNGSYWVCEVATNAWLPSPSAVAVNIRGEVLANYPPRVVDVWTGRELRLPLESYDYPYAYDMNDAGECVARGVVEEESRILILRASPVLRALH